MKKKKLIPFAFLGSLLIIAIFIIGVQYGKNVAEVDKTIHFLVSITPTKPVTAAPLPSTTYKSYDNKDCGVSFLYPSTFKDTHSSSTSGTLKDTQGGTITFSCDPAKPLSIDSEKMATASVMIEDKQVDASKSSTLYTFTILGKKRLPVYFQVSSLLIPLIEKTLKITK